VSVYAGVTIEDDVFVGPNVSFSNDKVPRAFNVDWKITPTLVKRGASIGANATIVCGVTIGEYAMIGAGSVVTRDVPAFSLAIGNPVRVVSKIDESGNRIEGQA
jgi:acetyltransferase-like isoleucine patch superfamily enzyme